MGAAASPCVASRPPSDECIWSCEDPTQLSVASRLAATSGPDYYHGVLGEAWTEAKPLPRALCKQGSFAPIHGTRSHGSGSCRELADSYTLEKRDIGWGTYGNVTIARHNKSGVRRAVKSVTKTHPRPGAAQTTLYAQREAEILREIDHPNIIRLFEVFENQSKLYLVLELCEGGNILKSIDINEPMSEQSVVTIFSQILGAVLHLHSRRIIHRDLKLENFAFVHPKAQMRYLPPAAWTVKLLDFGLARRLDLGGEVSLTPRVGTQQYMAPEWQGGPASVAFGDRADMWSIGMILHGLLTCRFPSWSPDKLSVAIHTRAISCPCRDLLGRLLCTDPEKRLTALEALRHPWFKVVAQADAPQLQVALSTMCLATSRFASESCLRRLALRAAAGELEDADAGRVRQLFRMLELECEGALTRKSLIEAKAVTGPVALLATMLLHVFESVDTDGSGIIGWTEMLAVALSTVENSATYTGSEHPLAEELIGDVEVYRQRLFAVVLRPDACWRAFDLLSQGEDEVSCESVHPLLVTPEASPVMKELQEVGPMDQKAFMKLVHDAAYALIPV